jgi:hypothetical protein
MGKIYQFFEDEKYYSKDGEKIDTDFVILYSEGDNFKEVFVDPKLFRTDEVLMSLLDSTFKDESAITLNRFNAIIESKYKHMNINMKKNSFSFNLEKYIYIKRA